MDAKQRIEELRSILKIEEKRQRAAEVEGEMATPSFWSNESLAQARSRELKNLNDEIKKFDDLNDIAGIASDDEIEVLSDQIAELELLAYFDEPHDGKDAIINFYAGAGGDDAQDWTGMLLAMYLRWAENNSDGAVILSETKGAEAGVKNATIEIRGAHVYGKLKGESGVHRLVRQSPFNAKSLRQTSFALVEVMPEIEASAEIEIDPKDLKVDTYRASGHGGQSVNTTDSAVRITHLPTGIVATCQNERSQLQNKETALKIVRSRIAKLMLDQHKERVEELKGESSSPEWGNQIRSYVLHPYKLVKDHRTGHESSNPDEVLSGNINDFIEADIKWLAINKPGK
ncbi:MAG: peptide chain release factor 2 [Patescibacteria group bacterium]|jgi:peptide chain release factor 2